MRFKSAGVAHVERIETATDWVMADKRALTHVFVNLAKNAIEALRDRPGTRALTFTVRSDPRLVHCSVHNLGEPISREHLRYIFRRGFSTKAGAGRGTGLALVHESVHRMQGTIAVTSTVEEGTTFYLAFPKAPEEMAISSQ
jgi:signal transduction histidine kinase